MNSDFMQQHAEQIAENVADEADDTARIGKVYRTLFGRAPTADEVKAGLEFLQAEAFKQYEDRKAEAAREAKDIASGKAAPKPAPARNEPSSDTDDETPKPDGMMAGVKADAKGPASDVEKMRPVTTFGRYVKILLSSNEFVFVS
jgi:hypothetical protein